MNNKSAGFTGVQRRNVMTAFLSGLYGYQLEWYCAGLDARKPVRNILKSRNIGATWYFAREMLMDAVMTGRNQVLIAPSEGMAWVAQSYLEDFARKAGLELPKGDIVLPNDAALCFTYPGGPKPPFAHGNVYVDEYAWFDDIFIMLSDLSDMAVAPRYRQTWYSSASTRIHEAYAFWCCGVPADDSEDFTDFRLCDDGQLRQVITIDTAVAKGFDQVDIGRLRREMSQREFIHMYQCEWMAA